MWSNTGRDRAIQTNPQIGSVGPQQPRLCSNGDKSICEGSMIEGTNPTRMEDRDSAAEPAWTKSNKGAAKPILALPNGKGAEPALQELCNDDGKPSSK